MLQNKFLNILKHNNWKDNSNMSETKIWIFLMKPIYFQYDESQYCTIWFKNNLALESNSYNMVREYIFLRIKFSLLWSDD